MCPDLDVRYSIMIPMAVLSQNADSAICLAIRVTGGQASTVVRSRPGSHERLASARSADVAATVPASERSLMRSA